MKESLTEKIIWGYAWLSLQFDPEYRKMVNKARKLRRETKDMKGEIKSIKAETKRIEKKTETIKKAIIILNNK